MAYPVTGALIFVEIKIGKEDKNKINYHLDLGETAEYTKRITEATKGLGQRNIKFSTTGCFILDSWFVSKRLAEAEMDAGYDIIGMVRTNTNVFCKDTIENLIKY